MKKSTEGFGEGEDLGKPFGRNGDVYRWLRANYEFVKGWRERHSPVWDTVAEKIATAGVVNRNGGKPAGRLVSRIWQRVCRDVEAAQKHEEEAERARAELAERRKNYPSRQGAGGAPQLAETSGRALVTTGERQVAPAATAPAKADEEKPETLRAATSILRQLSGHEPMQKKW